MTKVSKKPKKKTKKPLFYSKFHPKNTHLFTGEPQTWTLPPDFSTGSSCPNPS